MAGKQSAIWLLASALTAATLAPGCSKASSIATPKAVQRAIDAGSFRYTFVVDGTLKYVGKQHDTGGGQFEAPDRSEFIVGGKPHYLIGATWYFPDPSGAGYACQGANQPFLPVAAEDLLRSAARQKWVRGTSMRFGWHEG